MTIQVKITHANPGYERDIIVRHTLPDGRELRGPSDRIVTAGETAEFLVFGQQSLIIAEAGGSALPMDFGAAIRALKRGERVARLGWNGKGMWLALSCPESRYVLAEHFWSPHNAEYARQNGGTAKVLPSITMKTATGEILMGWLASQSDMLAEDWIIVGEEA